MRVGDWDLRLVQFVESRRSLPFVWGQRDCVALAADWIEVCTGESVFHGEHEDEAQAQAVIEQWGDLRQAVEAHLGDPLEHPLMAQRGDVVMWESERGPALGVCLGASIAAQGDSGLTMVPITAALAAWRV